MSFPEIGSAHGPEYLNFGKHFWMSFPELTQNCFDCCDDASFQTDFIKIIHFRIFKTFQKLMKSER